MCLSHWWPRGSPGGRGDSDVEKDRVGVFIDDLVHLRREKVPGIVLSIITHKHLEMEKIGGGTQMYTSNTTIHGKYSETSK